jgi:hypothetical protein
MFLDLVASALILQFSLQLRRGLPEERTQPGDRGTGRPRSVLLHGGRRNSCQSDVHGRRERIHSARYPLHNDSSSSCGVPESSALPGLTSSDRKQPQPFDLIKPEKHGRK